MITGANAGIGFETAKAIASMQGEVLLVARTREKAERAKKQILAETGNGQIYTFAADMGIQADVKRLGAEIRSQFDRIDVLINNAGTFYSKLTYTVDDIETVFAVNHLGYFQLTHELYPLLQEAPSARIINVSSDSHYSGKIDLKNLSLKGRYNGLRSYAQSKLANVLFTYELDRRKLDSNISVNVLHPGLVITDIGVKNTLWWHGLIWKWRRNSGVTVAEGAQTSIYLATSDEVEGMTGKYWYQCKAKKSSKLSYDETLATQLWDISLELSGIEDYFTLK